MMRGVRQKHTEPEVAVRRLLHRMGYRFRLHARELPGSPDIVFRPRKVAIFVHGCFWHGHHCRWTTRPVRSNGDYWAAKIDRNRRRDAAAERALHTAGWTPVIVWECELKDTPALADRLRTTLDRCASPSPCAASKRA